jgi:hypothetical protein
MTILWTTLTVVLAIVYARSVLIWGFLAYFFGWPAMLFLFAFGPKIQKWKNRLAAIQEFKKAYYGADEVEYKDFNNVDDLMKQLDTPKG